MRKSKMSVNQFVFHGVGQGLMYSGIIGKDTNESFTFLYDCGSKYKEDMKFSIQSIIPQMDVLEHSIDMMVISHFHDDHVNLFGCILDKLCGKKMSIDDFKQNIGKYINEVYIPYFPPKNDDAFDAYLVCNGIMPVQKEYSFLKILYKTQNDNVFNLDKNIYDAKINKKWNFYLINKRIDDIDIKVNALDSKIKELLKNENVSTISEFFMKDKTQIKTKPKNSPKSNSKDKRCLILNEIYEEVFGRNNLNITSLVLLHFPIKGKATLLTGDVVFSVC